MREHIPDSTLERLGAHPDSFSRSEREGVEAHLVECSLCRDRAERLREFSAALDGEMQNGPSRRDREFMARLLAGKRLALPGRSKTLKSDTLAEAYPGVVQPYPRAPLGRFVDYLRVHPVRFAGAASFAALGLVLAFLLIRPASDKNPAYARAKAEFLVAFNKDGEELWRHHIGPGYDEDKLQNAPNPHITEEYLATMDVDHDGRNEVISIVGIAQVPGRDVIMCYRPEGTIKWSYTVHRDIIFGTERFSDDYGFQLMAAGDFDKDGIVEVVAVALEDMLYPSDVMMLDASTGDLRGEYWHSGVIKQIKHRDLDGDGIEEIILGGTNNGYRQASLAVLDSRRIRGHSPAPPAYTPVGVPPGEESAYILFPRTDLASLTLDNKDFVRGIYFTPDSLVRVHTAEEVGSTLTPVMYYLNYRLECTHMEPDDIFLKFHQQFVAEGRLRTPADAAYFEALRRGIRYWDGRTFVPTPPTNPGHSP